MRFTYNRRFTIADLKGFCRVCRYGDLCRGGCTWKRYSLGAPASGDIYCFYCQAMKHRRYDLLEDQPTEAERSYFGRLAANDLGSIGPGPRESANRHKPSDAPPILPRS